MTDKRRDAMEETHKYCVYMSDGILIGAFNDVQTAVDYANSRVGKYRQLFVRDTSNWELVHYTHSV